MSRPSIRHLTDLEAFHRVGLLLDAGAKSLRSRASQLGMDLDTALDSIKRLELRYQRQLIARAHGRAGVTALTDDGKSLLKAAEQLLAWAPARKPPFKIAISNFLVTSGVLPTVITSYSSSKRRRSPSKQLLLPGIEGMIHAEELEETWTELEVSLKSDFSLKAAISDLENGVIDAIIAWEGSTSIQANSLWKSRSLGEPFDVVLVSWSKEIVDATLSRCDSPLRELDHLRGTRAAVISDDRQPLISLLPPNQDGNGCRRVPVHTYEEVLSTVAVGLADVGIVPAVYSVLKRFRRNVPLYYSQPLASIGIQLYTRNPPTQHVPEDVLRFLEVDVDAALRNHQATSGKIVVPVRKSPIPNEPSLLQNIKFGYYIDDPRSDKAREEEGDIPTWKSEEITVSKVTLADAGKFRFDGAITNCYGDNFKCDGTIHSGFIVVIANRIGESHNSVDSFATVLSWYHEECTALVGTWSGLTPDGEPSVYLTIWSQHELSLSDIHGICRDGNINSLAGPLRSVHIDTHG